MNGFLMASATVLALGIGGAAAEGYSHGKDKSAGMNSPSSTQMEKQAEVNIQSDEIEAAQEALKDEGYNIVADGQIGEGTRQAVRHYQQSNNMPVTGQLDRQTLASLEVDVDSNKSDWH